MGEFWLGQYLSNRTRESAADTTRDKIWLALRYLILVGSFIALVVLLNGDSPAAGFPMAIGGGLLASAIVNVAILPSSERKDALNALWAIAGVALLVVGWTSMDGGIY